VFSGFAGLKFSGSPIEYGIRNEIAINTMKKIIAPKRSLDEKKGWKEILSVFGFSPIGELDPITCKDIKWIIIIDAKIKGKRKCSIKNRLKVAPPTENPPHSHSTILFPMYGIAETRFVITVAPQNDIWPHGRTYPIKAVPISTKRITVPDTHVGLDLNEEKIIPRLIWIKITIKNIAAPFIWTIRSIQPKFTSRTIWITEEKAIDTLEL